MTPPKPVRGPVRVRIAPSPTGELHVGTVRTALFNWLFAKKHGGKFVLRIEDTDKERSEKKYEEDIIDGLRWLGIQWDEGPFRQSERAQAYKSYIKKLLDDKKAYRCFCSKEDLQKERDIAIKKGRAYVYGGACRKLSKDEIKKNISEAKPSIIRLLAREEEITFKDTIRGNVSFDMKLIGDFSIARDEKNPLYNLAVVIDDYEMEITHIIRGEDHIANTPKQIVIQEALKIPRPEYAHLPLLLNSDRSKMSKRTQATSVKEYRREYLPEALFNFIALLGWHPKHDKEILSKEEIVKAFDLGDVQKGGAVFDTEKLDWMNAQYIRSMPTELLTKYLNLKADRATLKTVGIVKGRMKKLSEFAELTAFLGKLPDYGSDLLIWKSTPKENIKSNLENTLKILDSTSEKEFTEEKLKGALSSLTAEAGTGEVLWPLRVALSGQKASPGPYEIMEVLGKKETLHRVEGAMEKLSHD